MLTTESGNPIHGDACVPGSCRDKGRGSVDEGALCLSWLGCDLCAPRSPHWSALPPGPHPAPHPPLVPTGPHSVVNIHQGDCSTCQGLFFKLNLALYDYRPLYRITGSQGGCL